MQDNGAKADTIPKLLVERCRLWGESRVAMRKKDFGVWQEYTWKDTFERVKYLTLALQSMGFERGSKIAILGDNDPEWYWLEYAAQCLGGIAVGIFVDSVPHEVEYIISHSNSVVVAARDQEQVDKILAIKDNLPDLRRIIYWDKKGIWKYDDPMLVSFSGLLETGRKYEDNCPDTFLKEVNQGKAEDIATICYTSGTTGLPKGVMISHEALIEAIRVASVRLKWQDTDEYVTFAPPAWILDQVNAVAGSPLIGVTLNFPEKPDTAQDDIREIAPQSFLFGSRQWESLASQAHVKMNDAPFIKKLAFQLFMPVGYKVSDLCYKAREPGLFWKCLFKIADGVLFRPLRDKMGLSRARNAVAGGTYVGPDTFRFFAAIGVLIKNGYGLTEVSFVTAQSDDDIKLGSAGTVLPGRKIRIDDAGEILVSGATLLTGYYKDDELTKEKLVGGYFHSGDAGYIDEDGHLYFMERMKDLMVLSGDVKFSPTFIESQLKFSQYIRDAMVIGDETKSFVTAIINIDYEAIGKWAERNRIPYTTFADLSQKQQVCNLVKNEIMRVNKTISPQARLRKFVNLYKEFDPDEAELTRTRKLRRKYMEERYRQLIDAMYRDKEEIKIEVDVKYRDGKTAKISTPIRVTSVEGLSS